MAEMSEASSATEWLGKLAQNHAPFIYNYFIELLAVVICLFVIGRLRRRPNGCSTAAADTPPPNTNSDDVSPASASKSTISDSEGYVLGTGTYSDMWNSQEPGGNDDDPSGFETNWKFVPFRPAIIRTDADMLRRSREFYELMNQRRTLRMFSDRPVPLEVVENLILTAGTAPSGGHTEPWTFVVVSDPSVKAELRYITETEERINYERRMGDKWVSDLRKLNTSWEKPYIETAPYVIMIFVQVYGYGPDGKQCQHYYHQISTAMATGLLMAAIHNAGLATVTSTPMNAGVRYQQLLARPPNEKFLMLLPIGFPADDALVPDLHRKPLSGIAVWK